MKTEYNQIQHLNNTTIKKEDSVKGECGMWDWHPLVVLCVTPTPEILSLVGPVAECG